MKKTVLVLMIITILSKAFGFFRDITLSYYYGASDITDAYLIAITIPTVIFSFIGTGVSTSYIPIFNKIKKKDGCTEGDAYTANLVNVYIIICSFFVFLGMIFTTPIVKIFALGFTEDNLNLAVLFTRWSIFGIYFTFLVYVFSSYLQVKGNYTIPALVAFPLNLFVIFGVIVSSKINLVFLPIFTLIGLILQFVILIPYIKKKGYKHSLNINFKDKHLIEMLYLSIPVIIGVSVNQINVLVDRTLASQIIVGGISSLSYANRVNIFVLGIFVSSISTVLYPRLSEKAAEKNLDGLKKILAEAINLINILIIPATFGAVIFSKPIVTLLFGRGSFDSNAITMTASALLFYAIGMLGFALREIFARTFYALEDTKTPMKNAVLAVIVNIVLNVVLSKYLGIGGLALATSISAILCSALLLIALRKKIGPIGIKEITITFLKILFASLTMGFISKLIFNYLTMNYSSNVSLLLSICIGVAVYFIIIYFMKIDDFDGIVNTIKNKIGKKSA